MAEVGGGEVVAVEAGEVEVAVVEAVVGVAARRAFASIQYRWTWRWSSFMICFCICSRCRSIRASCSAR